ncbi:conserved hypothetical protein [Theileria equi strain WA]|uniref:tRNA(Ile)-lysidine synthetase n=1 Tax=Theileria equi strain WA TaxID=1537102 RepID=L1LCH3_THEEQ|nr:conserved hypothetical protein [Theileria equi strain WA]EKX72979.1 conserved hypothetical protein [Theileria equi strain WA]|eukprot:XP_004832431.1 conserved hypothetical protein [Theileria equi strain WA]
MRIYQVIIKLVTFVISITEALSHDRFCFLYNNTLLSKRHVLLSQTENQLSTVDDVNLDPVLPQVEESIQANNLLFSFKSRGDHIDVKLHAPVEALWSFVKRILLKFYSLKLENDSGTFNLLPVVLSCSGGVDSMALLHSFGLIKKNITNLVSSHLWDKQLGGNFSNPKEVALNCLENFFKNFHVVYVDHQVRDDTDKDIKCISEACKNYGFDFIVKKLEHQEPNTADTSKGFQDMARGMRRHYCEELINTLPPVPFSFRELSEPISADVTFDMFVLSKGHLKIENVARQYSEEEKLLDKNPRGIVFMGHTLNDKIETILQKLLRGTHISNLSGMRLTANFGKDSVIVRPFIDIPKDELINFMNIIGESYHEDSTNYEQTYRRNLLRKRIFPELCNFVNTSKSETDNTRVARSLSTRFNNLSIQSEGIQDMINFEANMFEYYIFKKHGNVHDKSVNFSSFDSYVLESYYEMYTNLYNKNASQFYTKEIANLQRKIRFLRRIGLLNTELFHVDEWLLIQNRMVKEEILRRYILRPNNNQELNYRAIYDSVQKLESNPGTTAPKYFTLCSGAIVHQHYYLKHTSLKLDDLTYEQEPQFSDRYCKFYVHDGINATIKGHEQPKSDEFCLKFLVPIDPKTNSNGLSFDIRLIRNDDTVPCKSLWVPTAAALLARMHFPHILKDEIPVISVSGTNQVICFYGVNLNPPYCSIIQEELFNSDEYIKQPEFTMKYYIHVSK